MKRSPLKRTPSKKQQEKNRLWREITLTKWVEQNHKCSWCHQPTRMPTGHHIVKRRYNNHTKENCFVAPWLPCHSFIDAHSIDVTQYPTCDSLPEELRVKWNLYKEGVIHF